MRYFRKYLYGTNFTLVTDHDALRFINSFKDSNQRLLNWSLHMQDFSFDVLHKPGRLHQNVDALTRMPVAFVNAIDASFTSTFGFSLDRIKVSQQSDSYFSMFYFYLRDQRLPTNAYKRRLVLSLYKRFVLRNDLLYFVAFERGNAVYRLCIPSLFRSKILDACHAHAMSGHLGVKRTLSRVQERFYWKGMQKDVYNYVRSCDVCQQLKPGRKGPFPLMSIPIGVLFIEFQWK